jgi:hypothetical protein
MLLKLPSKKPTQCALRERNKIMKKQVEKYAYKFLEYFVNKYSNFLLKNNSNLDNFRNLIRKRADFDEFSEMAKKGPSFESTCSIAMEVFIEYADCSHFVTNRTLKPFNKTLHDYISCCIYIKPCILFPENFHMFKECITHFTLTQLLDINIKSVYMKKKTNVTCLNEQYNLLCQHIESSALFFFQYFILQIQVHHDLRHNDNFTNFKSIVERDFIDLCILTSEVLVDLGDCEHLVKREKETNVLLHGDIYYSLFEHFRYFILAHKHALTEDDDTSGSNYEMFKQHLMEFVPSQLVMVQV